MDKKRETLEAMGHRLESQYAQLNYILNDMLSLTDGEPDPQERISSQLAYISGVEQLLKGAVPMIDTMQTDMQAMARRLAELAVRHEGGAQHGH